MTGLLFAKKSVMHLWSRLLSLKTKILVLSWLKVYIITPPILKMSVNFVPDEQAVQSFGIGIHANLCHIYEVWNLVGNLELCNLIWLLCCHRKTNTVTVFLPGSGLFKLFLCLKYCELLFSCIFILFHDKVYVKTRGWMVLVIFLPFWNLMVCLKADRNRTNDVVIFLNM